MTLPAVINETRDKEYAAARKKALATIGEAVRIITVHGEISSGKDAEDFVEHYLKKQLSIAKTCSNNDLQACGIPAEITSLSDRKMTMPTRINDLSPYMSIGYTIDTASKSYGFLMSNGYSVNLFYNPKCLSDNKVGGHYVQDMVCVNAIYDMNGLRKPNTVGKDIGFVTILYPDESSIAVAPDVVKQNTGGDFDSIGAKCSIQNKEYTPPNRDELGAMFYNNNLLGINWNAYYWSVTPASAELGWCVAFANGYRNMATKSTLRSVRCVKR